jgi:hypothetical protein
MNPNISQRMILDMLFYFIVSPSLSLPSDLLTPPLSLSRR